MSAPVVLSHGAFKSGAGVWPSLDYIRNRIPITDVARALGLEVHGRSAHCYRPENHQHGDRSLSLSFTRRNYAKCHVCDPRAMSNLDLVMAVRGCDLKAAVEWITARWDVPDVERGKHANRRKLEHPRVRVGVSGKPLEELVRTGFWATLGKAAQSVLVVLLAFESPDTAWTTLSYRAIRRFANLSFGGVAGALRELHETGLLEADKHGGVAPLSACNRYRLNFERPHFLASLQSVRRQLQSEVDLEKELQKQRRTARKNCSAYTLGKSLSTRKSADQLRASLNRARDWELASMGANV